MTVVLAATIATFAGTTKRSVVAMFLPDRGRRLPTSFDCLVFGLTTASAFAAWESVPIAASRAVFFVGLLVLVEIDVRVMRLPREISWSIGVVSGALLVLAHPERAWPMMATAFAVLVLFLVLRLVGRRSLGDGDVRLVPVIGLHLGFTEPSLVVDWLVVTLVAAGLVSFLLVVSGRVGRNDSIPFGPFLAFGAITTLLVSAPW